MIDKVIGAIKTELDAYLKAKFPGTVSADDKLVLLTNLIKQDGTVAIQEENKILLTIVNIARDGSKGGRQGSLQYGKNPPTNLSLYLLVTAYFSDEGDDEKEGTNYLKGLEFLSASVGYFQNKGYLSSQNTPLLPGSLGTLSAELMELDFHQLTNMWSALGAKYMPSVLYRIRSVSITDDRIQRVDTDISDIEY